MDAPDLQLTIRYRDRTHVLSVAATPDQPRAVGRADFQRWFGLPADSLLSISKKQFSIVFSQGRFWIDETSRYGTFVRNLDAPSPPPYRQRRDARLALGRRTELRLINPNRADNTPDDLYIIVDNPGAGDTLALFDDPLWDQLLRRLENARAVHLVGLPGSGKWYLARQLMAADSREREQRLGLSTLPIAVDCLAVAPGDQPLWLAFARRLLLATGEAAEVAGYADAGRELAALLAQFDQRPPAHPDETMNDFQRAFEIVVKKTLQSPLIVLTNFDSVYSDLEPAMLYCLSRFRGEWPDISDRIYLVITTWRPLSRLRDDAGPDAADGEMAARARANEASFVRDFGHIFSDATLHLDHRANFRGLWDSVTAGRPLDRRAEEQLHRLTGANPGLLRDVLRRLQLRGRLDDPAALGNQLAAEDWTDPPLPTADRIWRVLRPDERDCLVALAAGRTIDVNREQELARLGLLDSDGRLFSAIFAASAGLFRGEEERHERGLRVDAANRRVLVDGQPVALRDGREMDILLALYEGRGRVVGYRELVEKVYGQPGQPYDDALIFNDKEALQRAIARLCERIDPQRAYVTNKHGVGYSLSAAVA